MIILAKRIEELNEQDEKNENEQDEKIENEQGIHPSDNNTLEETQRNDEPNKIETKMV